ncbi:hypothetical protein BGZ76_001003 [Entomortierella beljakovae]|nr:hypothetical protein BGZ76_001003 [Entomortierella beljakovae]
MASNNFNDQNNINDFISAASESISTSNTPPHQPSNQTLTFVVPNPTVNPNSITTPAILSPAPTLPNPGTPSGFSLPASNIFNNNALPKNPFSPTGSPVDTPNPSPPTTPSPATGLRNLNLGVERYARAIEDPGPLGSFSGGVPLPSLSQMDPIASKRRPSNALLDTFKVSSGHKTFSTSPRIEDEHGESSNKTGGGGIHLGSIKKAIIGRRKSHDVHLSDLEANNEEGITINDLGAPFGSNLMPANTEAQADLLMTLGYGSQPILLPAVSAIAQETFKEERQHHEENGQCIVQNQSLIDSITLAPVVSIHQQHQTVMIDPNTNSGLRKRKPKGGILSHLLRLQRHEAAVAASNTGSKQIGLQQQQQQQQQGLKVKKPKKSFYLRSSKNNSTADIISPSVSTTPNISRRNSTELQCEAPAVTRIPTQPQTTINNPTTTTASSRPNPRANNIQEMEALSAATTAAGLTARLGIHRDIAEILTRQSFLIMMAKALILYGAPSHRIEETCALLARKMEIDASFALLPGLMTISFSDPETHTSDTRHLRCTQGMDMNKLANVYTIAIGVLHGKDVDEANEALERVTAEAGYYPVWVTVLAWMSTSAFIAPLAFNGSWFDTVVAGICGLLVGLLGVVAAKFPVYGNVFELTCSILVGFISKVFGDRICFSAVALAGVVVLLPGLLLTQAIMEMASRNIVSGAVRMFYALMYAFFLGYGITLGAQIWDYIGGESELPADVCQRGVDPWWYFLIFPVVSASINIVFNAHPRQWFGMTIVTAIGFAVSYFMKAGPQVTPAVAAFAVGVAGQAYGRITGELSYVPLLSGVLILVPGSVGVRGVLAIIGRDPSEGFQFALQMVNISVSITLGVFCSALVWYPFWSKSTFMNF